MRGVQFPLGQALQQRYDSHMVSKQVLEMSWDTVATEERNVI